MPQPLDTQVSIVTMGRSDQVSNDQGPFKVFQIKFRTEYVCLKCGALFQEWIKICKICGGPICPRFIRVWR